MKPYYADHLVTLWHGDCIEVLTTLPDASVDSVVTDPPYGIGFMGRKWDKWGAGEFQSWCEQWSRECLRVLKPGGHMLAFGGTRTWHRLTVAVEDAGFEIRDSIAWMYGSGFPKSLDVSKALDKMAGAERGRKDLQHRKRVSDSIHASGFGAGTWAPQDDTPVTLDAQRWQGWGTALKPAFEPIVVARKPLAGTVAANVLAHGTGALNIAACRIGEEELRVPARGQVDTDAFGDLGPLGARTYSGRWPANVILDETQAAELDSGIYDMGGASRFFYISKADTSERPRIGGVAHPTVKPLTLMRWLVRLVTPTGGLVLEPFAGSGATVEACLLEGFRCIAIEKDADHLPLITQRIHRQRDPVEAIRQRGEDLGLFDPGCPA